MPQITVDCQVVIDDTGYWIKPGTCVMKQPRVRQASYRADGSLAYVDLGPGRRAWTMTILCVNELKRYDGALVALSGQQYRDALRASYTNNIGATINYIDPLNGATIPVHFDAYEEKIIDLHSQIIALADGGSAGASYEVTITLLEA